MARGLSTALSSSSLSVSAAPAAAGSSAGRPRSSSQSSSGIGSGLTASGERAASRGGGARRALHKLRSRLSLASSSSNLNLAAAAAAAVSASASTPAPVDVLARDFSTQEPAAATMAEGEQASMATAPAAVVRELKLSTASSSAETSTSAESAGSRDTLTELELELTPPSNTTTTPQANNDDDDEEEQAIPFPVSPRAANSGLPTRDDDEDKQGVRRAAVTTPRRAQARAEQTSPPSGAVAGAGVGVGGQAGRFVSLRTARLAVLDSRALANNLSLFSAPSPPRHSHQHNEGDATVDSLDGQGGHMLNADWLAQQSREELEDLLREADRAIRERQRDLEIAASLGKSLLEENVALRRRQDSLLAHKPSTSPTRSRRSLLGSSSGTATAAASGSLDLGGPGSPQHSRYGSSATSTLNSSSSSSGGVHSLHRPRHSVTGSMEHDAATVPPRNTQILTLSRDAGARAAATLIGALPGNSTPSTSSVLGGTPSSTASSNARARMASNASISSLFAPSPRRAGTGSIGGGGAASATSPVGIHELRQLEQANYALTLQLTELECDAEHAEREGKKRLRRLEKEITSLRLELSRVEQRNESLEHSSSVAAQSNARNVGVGRTPGRASAPPLAMSDLESRKYVPPSLSRLDSSRLFDDGDDAVPLTSPAARTFRTPRGGATNDSPSLRSPGVGHSILIGNPGAIPDASTISVDNLAATSAAAHDAAELERTELLAELVDKIDELKATNLRLSDERAVMDERLGHAQLELDRFRQRCDELEDDLAAYGLEWPDRKEIEWRRSSSGSGEEGEELAHELDASDASQVSESIGRARGNQQMIARSRAAACARASAFPASQSESSLATTTDMSESPGRFRKSPRPLERELANVQLPLPTWQQQQAPLVKIETGSDSDLAASAAAADDEDIFSSAPVATLPIFDDYQAGRYRTLDEYAESDDEGPHQQQSPPPRYASAMRKPLHEHRSAPLMRTKSSELMLRNKAGDSFVLRTQSSEIRLRDRNGSEVILRQQGSDLVLRRHASAYPATDPATRHRVSEADTGNEDDYEHVDGRKCRNLDYYPLALRARYHPRMLARRLADASFAQLLAVITWVQFLLVISVAVSFAIAKGPSKTLRVVDGRHRRLPSITR